MARVIHPNPEVGTPFGEWEVTEVLPRAEGERQHIRCRCSCGKVADVLKSNLLGGRSTHCKGHPGITSRPEYGCWKSMKARCSNPHNNAFANYGGRGIKVCARWESFEAFLEDVGPRPSPEYSLERDRTSGDYEPGNVRWATMPEQSRNKRTNRTLTIDGETLVLRDWSIRSGNSYETIRGRLNAGWDAKEAVFTPPLPNALGRNGRRGLNKSPK